MATTPARKMAEEMEAVRTGKAWDEPLVTRAYKRITTTPRSEDEMGELTREVRRAIEAPKKYAKGGSVSSASKRADGCCQRGKTKGKML